MIEISSFEIVFNWFNVTSVFKNHNFIIIKIIGNEIQVWISIFHDIDIYGNDDDVDIF